MSKLLENRKLFIILSILIGSLLIILLVLTSLLPKKTTSNNLENNEHITIDNNLSENTENVTTNIESFVEKISINKSKIILNLQDIKEKTLVATITPSSASNQIITWISCDDSIAIVDNNGKVTAISEGETSIIAICGEISCSCIVQVISNLNADININEESIENTEESENEIIDEDKISTKIETTNTANSNKKDNNNSQTSSSSNNTVEELELTLDKTNIFLNLTTKTKDKLTANTNIKNKKIYYTSTNKNVVNIDKNGNITAVGVGTANIIVSCLNKTATCSITVTNNTSSSNNSDLSKNDTVKNISLNASNISLVVNGNNTFNLKATVSPTNSSVSWSSSNNSIASVTNNGVVTAKRKW